MEIFKKNYLIVVYVIFVLFGKMPCQKWETKFPHDVWYASKHF